MSSIYFIKQMEKLLASVHGHILLLRNLSFHLRFLANTPAHKTKITCKTNLLCFTDLNILESIMLYFQISVEVGISGIKHTITDTFHGSFVSHLEPVLEYCQKNGKYNLSL